MKISHLSSVTHYPTRKLLKTHHTRKFLTQKLCSFINFSPQTIYQHIFANTDTEIVFLVRTHTTFVGYHSFWPRARHNLIDFSCYFVVDVHLKEVAGIYSYRRFMKDKRKFLIFFILIFLL